MKSNHRLYGNQQVMVAVTIETTIEVVVAVKILTLSCTKEANRSITASKLPLKLFRTCHRFNPQQILHNSVLCQTGLRFVNAGASKIKPGFGL